MSDEILRALVDLRDRQIQKARIQFGNRLDALMRQADNGQPGQVAVVRRWYKIFWQLEERIDDDIAEAVEAYPIYEHMVEVKGVGPTLSAQIIAMIDIERAPTVSSLWRYSGYGLSEYWQNEDGDIVAPVTGFKYDKDEGDWVEVSPEPEDGWEKVTVRDRLIGGYRSPYNKRLKTTLWKLAGSFMKAGSPYRDVYDRAKAKYAENRDWTKGHIHNAARRKMIKLWLSHCWVRWRTLEGLPTREPYAHEYLDHTTLELPEDYGWPKIEEMETTLAGATA